MLKFERKASKQGFTRIAGVDEAGRGPLAGPVVAASVTVINPRFSCPIDDSKKLSASARERAFKEISEKCQVGVGIVGRETIDSINIFQATRMAMRIAVLNMPEPPDILLVDGNLKLELTQKSECIIKGDSKSLSIACASIIAKVTRDRIMRGLHEHYPQYGFSKHKGYGTRAHMEAIFLHGPCPEHRLSFQPVKGLLEKQRIPL